MATLESVNGRQTFFGPTAPDGKFGATVAGDGPLTYVEVVFSYDDLPDADSGNDMLKAIPANAKIVSADLFVTTAFVGGTNLTTGADVKAGTVIDADGFHGAILTAALTANSVHVGGGALIGKTIGTSAGVPTVTTTGTFTAGEGRLVIGYMAQGADVA